MKKDQRVKKNHEFSQIISRKQYVKTPAFAMHLSARKEDHARIGISVGKRMGNAVTRNKIKRQLRAMIDSVFTFDEPYDAIIIVRPAYAGKKYSQLLEDLVYLHDKAAARKLRGKETQ